MLLAATSEPSVVASLAAMQPTAASSIDTERQTPDPDSQAWLDGLRASGAAYDEAVARLHALLLRAARFEVNRRRSGIPQLRGDTSDDIALEAANDATVSVLARLEDYRGLSRFTTWAYKFALLEAAVKLRRRAWQGREIPLEPDSWAAISTGEPSPQRQLEHSELLNAIRDGIQTTLTPHQRSVFNALALNQVPIDVLADRLNTTRGALYKTLHDARRRLRRHLATSGLAPSEADER